MAATVLITRWSGASSGPTTTDITSTTNRAQTGDGTGAGSPTTSPIPVPTSGTNYSYWVSTRLSVSAAAAGSITNVRWYTDGANSLGTGVGLNVATATTYVQATGTPNTTGNQLTSANHNFISGYGTSATDAFAKTSAAPISVNGSIGSVTGGAWADFVVYQVTVVNTAGPGVATESGITYQYDET